MLADYTLASRIHLHERAKRRKRKQWLSLGFIVVMISGWYLSLAPSSIGGPVTYAIISGTSMEPNLHTGDLVLTRSQQDYTLGDTVLVSVMGGFVIHDIIWKSGNEVKTRGVNNDFDDTWTIPISKIIGKEQLVLPGLGHPLMFLRDNPIALGAGAAAIAGLVLFEPRRTRVSKRLGSIIEKAKQETPVTSRNYIDALFTALFIMAAFSMFGSGLLLANHADFFPRVFLSLLGVTISILAFEIIGTWITRGRDLAEPYRSLEVFRNRLYSLPPNTVIPGETLPVKDALTLLKYAELSQSPVLHLADSDFRDHQFVVVTDDLNYLYRLNTRMLEATSHPRHRK